MTGRVREYLDKKFLSNGQIDGRPLFYKLFVFRTEL